MKHKYELNGKQVDSITTRLDDAQKELELIETANGAIHFEFESAQQKEVEVYIGGWFLTSVDIAGISPEAKEYLLKDKSK